LASPVETATAPIKSLSQIIVVLSCTVLFFFHGHYYLIIPGLTFLTAGMLLLRLPTWKFLLLCLTFLSGCAVDTLLPPLWWGIIQPLAVGLLFLILLRHDFLASLRLPKITWALWLVPIFVLIAGYAMDLWFKSHPPSGLIASFRHQPVWFLWFAFPTLMALNATGEEMMFRGAFFCSLRPAFGTIPSVAVQALAFGLWHWYGGIPNGWSGFLMTFSFGLGMGWLRVVTGSLWPGIVVHAAVGVFMAWWVTGPNVY